MSSSHRSRDARAALGPWLLATALSGAPAASASDDEVTGLLVTKDPAGVRLRWDAPVVPADSYQVRRCVLSSLRAGSYGNCIASGLTAEEHVDASPLAGAVFYLASGSFAGSEGPLGESFDGATRRSRTTAPCDMPTVPGPLTVVVYLDDAVESCGSDTRFTFPREAMQFGSGTFTGIEAGFFGLVVENPPGVVAAAAGSTGAPASGPGEIARVLFDRGECPVTVQDLRVLRCDVVVPRVAGDCGDFETRPQRCHLEIP